MTVRVLHILAPLVPEGAAAVSRLVDEQRIEGHTVAVAPVHGRGGAAGVSHFVSRTLGGAARFDLIHAHGTAAVPVSVSLASVGQRTPVVATLHDWVHDGGIRAAQPHIPSLTRADIVTAPSPLAASLAASVGVRPQRIRVIPYPVDATPRLTAEESVFDRQLVEWRRQGGDVLCAAVHDAASVYHETVLQALTCVSSREGLLCLLAGAVDPDACATLALRLGVDDRIRVCGPRIDPRAMAARCDYLTLPAFDERRPFALVEAWCDGIPVIAGRNAQFAGVDADGNGTVFFDARDPADLARAIATVRGTTPAARRLLVERARVLYRQQFAPRAVYAAYMTEYASVRRRARSAEPRPGHQVEAR